MWNVDIDPVIMQSERATNLALHDPRIGDLYTDGYAFWAFVVHRNGGTVTTLEISATPADCIMLPDDGKLITQTYMELDERMAYWALPGYWARLARRGIDVFGWYERALLLQVEREQVSCT